VHWLAYVCWPVAVAHGLGIGTDRSSTWVVVLSLVCVLAVLATTTWRLVTAARLGPAQ
jgi:sulfoxide reductase heme-binding subunit YedZ